MSWRSLPAVWRGAILVGAILGAGAAGHAKLATYATRDDLRAAAAGEASLRAEVGTLRERVSVRDAAIETLQRDVTEVKQGVTDILRHLLEHPPRRRP